MINDIRKSQSGYTLAEILVSISLLAGFIYIVSNLITEYSSQSSSSIESLNQSVDVSVFFSWLQRNTLKKNLVIQGFTGGSTKNYRSRLIVPYPGKCGDLTSSCPEDVALQIPVLDIGKTPIFTSICLLDANRLIVDLSYDHFGKVSLKSNGIKIDTKHKLFGGELKIQNKSLLLSMDGTHSLMVRANGSPSSFNPKFNSSTGFFDDLSFASNPNCLAFVKDHTKLIQIPISVYIIPQSGVTFPPDAEIKAGFGQFPLLLTAPKMASLGRNAKMKQRWGLRICDPTTSDPCKKDENLFIDKIGKVDLFESFSRALGSQSNEVRYSLGKSSDCSDGTCKNLQINDPILFMAGDEQFSGILNDTIFTFIKQDFLEKIEFQVEDLSGKSSITRRYSIEVL